MAMTPAADLITIRAATPEDAERVAAIYNEGIVDGVATFETRQRDASEVVDWFDHDLPFLVATSKDGAAHLSAGFHEVGVQLRHGRLDGQWKDCVLVERLLGDALRSGPPAASAQPA
jgi:L-amino acid N-acyltransferase YncA